MISFLVLNKIKEREERSVLTLGSLFLFRYGRKDVDDEDVIYVYIGINQ